jgi:hypothetical protein
MSLQILKVYASILPFLNVLGRDPNAQHEVFALYHTQNSFYNVYSIMQVNGLEALAIFALLRLCDAGKVLSDTILKKIQAFQDENILLFNSPMILSLKT